VNAGIRDTAAWQIIEQLLEHVWGKDDMTDSQILSVSLMFHKAGGSWKRLMEGERDQIGILEECVGNVLQAEKLERIAASVSGKLG
jgi:hypothetical protein